MTATAMNALTDIAKGAQGEFHELRHDLRPIVTELGKATVRKKLKESTPPPTISQAPYTEAEFERLNTALEREQLQDVGLRDLTPAQHARVVARTMNDVAPPEPEAEFTVIGSLPHAKPEGTQTETESKEEVDVEQQQPEE
jgi:hypothetical protein